MVFIVANAMDNIDAKEIAETENHNGLGITDLDFFSSPMDFRQPT